MNQTDVEVVLVEICAELTQQANVKKFSTSEEFERAVRTLAAAKAKTYGISVELNPAAQAFPDIAIGDYGIEVKFTANDTWRSVANSVQESNRVDSVKLCIWYLARWVVNPRSDGRSTLAASCMFVHRMYLVLKLKLEQKNHCLI